MNADADDIETARHSAWAYLDAGNHRRAREVLGTALALAPDDPVLLVLNAFAALGLRDYIGAERSAWSALKLAPASADGVRAYALALRGQRRLVEAEWWAWRAAYGSPDDYLTRMAYAEVLADIGRLREAELEVNEAIRLQSSDPDLFVLRGNIFRRQNRIAESDADIREALRLRPDHAVATHNLAVNRLSRGRLSEALRGFLGAGGLDPSVAPLARRNIAVVVTKMLRRCTWMAMLVIWGAVQLGIDADAGRSTIFWRVFVGVSALALGGAVGLFVRSVPIRTLGALLKAEPILLLRSVLILIAVAGGVVCAVSGVAGSAVSGAVTGALFKIGPPLLLFGAIALLLGHYTRR